MRNNAPIFWPSADYQVSKNQQRQKNYTDCINILQTQWYQGDLDQRFVMGDQDLWGLIYPGVATYRRKIFNFNIINGMVQTASGFQRRNRKNTIVIPVHHHMQKTADQLTKCLFHVLNHSGVYQVYSDCFEKGALTKGLGFLSTYIDYTEDIVSGNIKKRYVDMASCLFDPYFRRHDMSDCRFWWTRQFFDRNEAADLYPDLSDYILGLPSGTYRDDKFYYMPEVYQIQFPNLIAFDEYWYLSSREALFLVDINTEECQEFRGDEEDLRDLMHKRTKEGIKFHKILKVEKKSKPTVRRSIIINDKEILDEPNPYKIDRYPVVPCLGYFNPDTPYYSYKFRGLVRDARDSQYLFNLRKVTDLDILQSQQQGLKMEKGALVTPDDSLNQGNGRVLTTQPGMLDKVVQMDIHPPSPVMLEMETMLKDICMQITGVTPEMMGQEIDDKAGIISMIRQSASVTRLQTLFDQFDEFQRLDGDLTVEMIQRNFSFGKVKQIINEEPSPEFDNQLFFKYGAKVVPGILTESQQQLEAHQLLHLRSEIGIPVPTKRILQTLTVQNKDELIKEIEEAEQQQNQMAQQRAMLEMQQLQVDNETKLSYAQSQKSLANERQAKIKTDMAVAEDKLKRAHEQDTHSMLNLLKALKELQGVDIDNLTKQLNLLSQASSAISPSTDENRVA